MMNIGVQIPIDILADLIDGRQEWRVGLRGGVSERAIDVPTDEPGAVRPATGQIIELYLGGRRMPSLEKGTHVLDVIGPVGRLDAVDRIGHDEDPRGQVAGVELGTAHRLLDRLHDLGRGVLDVAEEAAGAAFQRAEET